MRILLALIAILTAMVSMAAAPKKHKTCPIGPLRVGVIDTGFGFHDLGHTAHLCNYGHKDFTVDQVFTKNYATAVPVPLDVHSHGTNVVGLIEEYANEGSRPYCIVILKYYSDKVKSEQNMESSLKALKYANNLHLNVINYSGGGEGYSELEKREIVKFLDRGGIFVAAAGNEGKELGVEMNYFPAMYDSRIKVVGNQDLYNNRVKSSNFGRYVNTWEWGDNRLAFGIVMSGTSQATAATTGKIVAKTPKSCDR